MPLVTDPTIIKKKSLRDLPLQKKRVLVRVDYNVPLDSNGRVSDDTRIRATLPTLEYLLRQKAKVILISHMGRPKGQINPKYSLKPLVEPLKILTRTSVYFADNCVGPMAFDAVAKIGEGEILLLENLRFHQEEEKGNSVFAKELASLADFFVQDAFGTVHRAHASTTQVPSYLESAAGSLLEKELKFLSALRANPPRPYTAILGGAKVSDKIGVVEAFLKKVDSLFIGGAMAYTFLKAKGFSIGDSLFEVESLEFCETVLSQAKEQHVEVILPLDHLIVQDIEKPESAQLTNDASIPDGWKGVDIGPKTLNVLRPKLEESKTIFWNGPVGIFEVGAYSKGTMEIAGMAASVAKKGTTVVVGGGDSVAAVEKAGVAQDMTFISTGGGASLEFLEGKDLPGIAALPSI